jgi:hypothetical protein
MQVRAERGELRITRETFAEHFDAWLKGHHRASKATRDGYRAAGERRLKPYFGLTLTRTLGTTARSCTATN